MDPSTLKKKKWSSLSFPFIAFVSLYFFFLFFFLHGNEESSISRFVSPSEINPLPLTLEKAVSQALKSNRQLLSTAESLTQAQYGVDLAKCEFNLSVTPNSQAGYFGRDHRKGHWTVGGGVDFSKKLTTGTLISVIPSIVKRGDHYLTEIQTVVTQPLLRGFGKEYQLANLKGAQFALRTAYRNVAIAQIQLVLRTIQTLYEVVKLERLLELNQESYHRLVQFRKATGLKEKIGLSDALDVYRADMELRYAEDAVKSAKERFEETKDVLRDLLAFPLDLPITVDIPVGYTSFPVDVDLAVNVALKNRIEVEQSEDERWENERLSSLAKKNLCPELNLVLNFSNLGRGKHFSQSCTRNRESEWGVGLTTSSDFNPAADQIAYEQSLLNLASSSRGIEQTEATIILEVKKVARQLDRAAERIRLQEEQIKTAQGELRLAHLKFNRGMADNFNVIQAEKSLRGAEQQYWSAMIDHIVGEFQMLAAMGLLMDKPYVMPPRMVLRQNR